MKAPFPGKNDFTLKYRYYDKFTHTICDLLNSPAGLATFPFMAATPALQVLTANRLRDGDVVYWRDGAWVDHFAAANVFNEKAAADAALEAAQAFVKGRVVVAPYLFAVREDGGRIRAIEEREIIRSEGPSVRRDLGKQAMDSFDVSI
jgi:hypothetical protein